MLRKSNQKGFIDLHLAIALVVILIVGGFVIARIQSANETTSASQDGSSQEELLQEDVSELKTIEEIQEIASGQSDSVSVVSIELKNEDGVSIYVVRLSDGSMLAFNASTGESVSYDDDKDEDGQGESLPANFVPGVSLSEAITIAKSERPNSRVEKVELEFEDGEVVYSVRFSDDSRVDVRADDGTVVRVKDENGNKTTDLSSDDDDDDQTSSGSDDDDDDDEDDEDEDDEADEADDDDDDDDDEDAR